MARTLEVRYLSGVSLTIEVVARGADAITETITMTERTTAKTVYTGPIATAGAGDYELAFKIGSSYVGVDDVRIEATDATTYRSPLKTGYSLASTGLDALTIAEPTGVPTTFVGWFMWLIRRFAPKTPSGKVTMPTSGNGNLVVFASDGTTPITTQAVTSDGTTQTLNKVS